MCCKSVCVEVFARHTHMSKTPIDSFYFYRYISVKMAMIVCAINRFIPPGYAKPALSVTVCMFFCLFLCPQDFGNMVTDISGVG